MSLAPRHASAVCQEEGGTKATDTVASATGVEGASAVGAVVEGPASVDPLAAGVTGGGAEPVPEELLAVDATGGGDTGGLVGGNPRAVTQT